MYCLIVDDILIVLEALVATRHLKIRSPCQYILSILICIEYVLVIDIGRQMVGHDIIDAVRVCDGISSQVGRSICLWYARFWLAEYVVHLIKFILHID